MIGPRGRVASLLLTSLLTAAGCHALRLQTVPNSTEKPRPSSPYYSNVSKAIADNSYAAIRNEKTVEQALADIKAGIETAGN